MPEILEIEQYRRRARSVVGRVIVGVSAPDRWYCKGATEPALLTEALVGDRIVAARRRGKLLLLDTAEHVLGLRFGMTGRLLVDGDAAIDQLEYSSRRDDPAWDRFGLTFDRGDLIIRDPRRLGGVELDPDEARLGPDAWTLTGAELGTALGSGNGPLKARLLDQARVAGLGNLLVDEILWRSGLDPARPAGSLDARERRRLRDRIRSTLDELDRRGGSHTGDLHEHRRAGGSCPRDQAPLRRRTIGGRTTYDCPEHQR